MASLMRADGWHIAAGTARGHSHVDHGLPNQDSFTVKASEDGTLVVAVISDGAGTAARADEGSSKTTRALAETLFRVALGEERSPGIETLTAALTQCIEGLRREFLETGAPLCDFHCTFVACLLSGDSGFIAYVGDSAAMTTSFARACTAAGNSVVDFFPDGKWRLYELERGEYSNETHFITEPNWHEFLRVEELPTEFDALVLMTDGAMDVAMSRGTVFRGFLSNLVAKLADTEARAERDAIIEAWLDDRQTFAVTADDKTLFLALRGDVREAARHEIYLGEAQAPLSVPSTPEATSVRREVTPSPRRDAAKWTQPSGNSWDGREFLAAMVFGFCLVMVLAFGGYLYVTLKRSDDWRMWDARATATWVKSKLIPPDSTLPQTEHPKGNPPALESPRPEPSEPAK
jgi:hypothetical protein